MKLRSITLENVRRFTAPTRIAEIGDGLNLLCEPNEHGKSTLFDAVQALFFKPHGSRDREVMSLRPHAGGAPQVTIEVETNEGSFTIEKRWLSKASASVTRGGTLVARNDQAEAWIARLLGSGEGGGPSGLVWVRQGMTGLALGSKREQDAALEARRDLMSSVGQEVEAMTGGRRMDHALSRCRAELERYATPLGRARAGGPWKGAQDEVESLSVRRNTLHATATALHEALDARRRLRRELAELEAEDAETERRTRLEQAAAACDAARKHAEAVEVQTRKVETARIALGSAHDRLQALREAEAERAQAEDRADATTVEACAARRVRDEAEAALGEAQRRLDDALAAHKAAEDAQRGALRRQAARDGASRREDLAARIEQAETARKEAEHAAAEAAVGPDAKALRKLEGLASALDAARQARDAAATRIVMHYAPEREGAVRLGDTPLADDREISLPHGARLTLADLGELEIRTGAIGQDDGVEEAEQALRQALDALGVADVAAARAASDARALAERRAGEARAVLASLAPEGLDRLREALAAIPAAADADEGPGLAEAEAALRRAEDARVAAQAARDAAAERRSDARAEAARAEAAVAEAGPRLARARAALERLGPVAEADLVAQFDRAAEALRADEALLAETSRSAPDLAAAEAALRRARSIDEEARAAIAGLKPEIARLDERIARGSGDAVEERLAETEQELAAARENLSRIEHEVRVLQRLEAALEAARTQARDRYFAPVAAELRPLLQLLWPDAELTWEQDTLLPDALIRSGAEEPIDILSGGTQEQVALLVRLAFARMLDRWLRERRFCDLFAVVRGGVAASEPSYSIKDMEALYGFARSGAVQTAGGSVVAYEDWRETGDEAILREIEDYNRLDCISTQELRDWLVGIRPEGPWPAPAPPQEERHDERAAAAEALRSRLLAADLPAGRGALLFDLAQFHAREAKPAAWAVFDAAARTSEELCDDMDCLGGLVASGPPEPEKKSIKRSYRFPPQDTKLRAGSDACIVQGEGVAKVSLLELDRKAGLVTVKLTPAQGDHLPERLDLLPSFALNAEPIPQAIMTVVADQLGGRTNRAADDLLSRSAPRLGGPSPLPVPDGADPLATLIAATEAMDDTVLPVQGPPGTGKTWITARAILNLVRQGKRVAVTSNSHEAIGNLLRACVDALEDADLPFVAEDVSLAQKGKPGEALPAPYDRIAQARSNDDPVLAEADVVGGTAWLFSRTEMRDAFDYLFVDEAGQVSLANLVAMTNAARNVVLVGDPNQLPQVVQGAHPHPANLSCLDWMIGDDTTIRPERGLFLPVTRRMHPALCGYISGQFYEGRLTAHPGTALQRVDATGLPAAGAFLVPVAHEGRAQESPEEIEAIRRTVAALLAGSWTDSTGATRRLRAADIIVVAPYNLQVNALSEALTDLRVGTVDRFQGQEAAVALISMTASSAEETSRGLDFLLARERLNVAISRGKALSLVFAAPRLMETQCATVEQMRLVNALCALPVWLPDVTT